MLIGQVAAQTGVTIQTLRYYEQLGLMPAPARRSSGYRTYAPDAVQRVRFIRRAQEIGFTLHEIADLLGFWPDSKKSCGRVEKQAAATLERIDEKIRDLRRIRSALAQYLTACRDRRSFDECPLLASLGADQETRS
jgi:MerR family copper efflux transcriptional regulator